MSRTHVCVSRMQDPQAVCSADGKEGRPGAGTAAEQTQQRRVSSRVPLPALNCSDLPNGNGTRFNLTEIRTAWKRQKQRRETAGRSWKQTPWTISKPLIWPVFSENQHMQSKHPGDSKTTVTEDWWRWFSPGEKWKGIDRAPGGAAPLPTSNWAPSLHEPSTSGPSREDGPQR